MLFHGRVSLCNLFCNPYFFSLQLLVLSNINEYFHNSDKKNWPVPLCAAICIVDRVKIKDGFKSMILKRGYHIEESEAQSAKIAVQTDGI